MTDWLRYDNQGATRNLPLSQELVGALGFLPSMGVSMEVFSGGQPESGKGPRVGSVRHDHGGAADVYFYKDGRRLDWANPQDVPVFQEIVRKARANGVTGFGAGDGYMRPGSMHIGFGKEAVWGAGGKGANAPEWLRVAFSEGANMPKQESAKPFNPFDHGAIAYSEEPKPKGDPFKAVLGEMPYTVNNSAPALPVTPVAGNQTPFNPFEAGATTVDVPAPASGESDYVQPAPPAGMIYDPTTNQMVDTANIPSDRLRTFTRGVVEGVPVAGPAIRSGLETAAAAVRSGINGTSMADERVAMERAALADASANPGTALAGNLTGSVLAITPAAATATGARLLGMTGNSLLGRMAASGGTNALVSGADTLARGGTVQDAGTSAAIGGAIGAAIPAALSGVKYAGQAAADYVAPRINMLARSPVNEAGRRVTNAFNRDAVEGGLNNLDVAAAQANAQDIRLIDRGGETVRALARSAANTSPEGRGMLESTLFDRWGGQSSRAMSFLNRITGGATDDLTARQALQDAAKAANGPAYQKAFSAPSGQQVFTPGLQDLTRSPAIKRAIMQAETRGANRAVSDGFKPVVNPFHEGPDGALKLRMKANGELAAPTLAFWDQVKRNIDSQIGKVSRAGDKTLASDLIALKNKLVSELDSIVPEYQAARRGAAAFFDAEDAMDAGMKFVSQNKDLNKAMDAIRKMKPAEREAFQVGFASRLRESIGNTADSRDVVNKIFGTPNARAKIKAVFGPDKMREFETFAYAETAMKMVKNAVASNSTTARQLAELGMGGGAGFYVTGDWKGAALGAVMAKAGQHRNSAVAREVARILLSEDPQAAVKATQLALKSNNGMAIMKSVSKALDTFARAGGLVVTGAAAQ